MSEEVVAVGQRWVSRDPRDNGRTVKVVHLGGGNIPTADVENIDTYRRTSIKVSSLRSKYRLAFDQPKTMPDTSRFGIDDIDGPASVVSLYDGRSVAVLLSRGDIGRAAGAQYQSDADELWDLILEMFR